MSDTIVGDDEGLRAPGPDASFTSTVGAGLQRLWACASVLEGRGASMSSDDLALYVSLTWLRLVGAGLFCSGMLLTAVPLGGGRVLGVAALVIGLVSTAASIVWAGVAAHRVLVRRDPMHGPGVVELSEETNRWTGSWYLEEAETVLTRPGLAAKVRRGWIGLMVGAVGGVLVVAIASAFT